MSDALTFEEEAAAFFDQGEPMPHDFNFDGEVKTYLIPVSILGMLLRRELTLDELTLAQLILYDGTEQAS